MDPFKELFVKPKTVPHGPRDCRDCKWLSKAIEGYECEHIWWWECRQFPGRENLLSFPFRNTKCKGWEKETNNR